VAGKAGNPEGTLPKILFQQRIKRLNWIKKKGTCSLRKKGLRDEARQKELTDLGEESEK